MRSTICCGVSFFEGRPEGFSEINEISIQINSGFGQDQLKNLRDVKEKMAIIALEMGGNCITNFRYGQRSGGFWAQMWSIDNCMWFGSGVVGRVDGTQ